MFGEMVRKGQAAQLENIRTLLLKSNILSNKPDHKRMTTNMASAFKNKIMDELAKLHASEDGNDAGYKNLRDSL